MQFVRALIFNILFYSATIVLSLMILPGLLMPFRAVVWFKQLWLHLALALTRGVIGIHCEERGRENIPDGPVIFAAKHQSAWDTLALGEIHPLCAFVLKRELTWVPIWGWFLIRLKMIPIDRSKGLSSMKKITRAASSLVAEGRSILIFPQGTRTPSGARRPYLPGVAAIYKGSNVPVVPVALNSGLFWPRRRMGKRPGTIVLEYLKPIEPGLDRATFMARLEDSLELATARLEAEALERYAYLPRLQLETADLLDAKPAKA